MSLRISLTPSAILSVITCAIFMVAWEAEARSSLSVESVKTITELSETYTDKQEKEFSPQPVELKKGKKLSLSKEELYPNGTPVASGNASPKGNTAPAEMLKSTINGGGEVLLKSKEEVTSGKILQDAYKALMADQLESAAALYEKAMASNAADNEIKFSLACVYQRLGEDQEAKKLYALILKNDPNHFRALNNFLTLIGKESPEEAINQFKRLEAAEPRLGLIPAQIGMVYAQIGELKKSLKYLNKALQLDPKNLTYLYNLAVLLDRAGDKRQAVEAYRQLILAGQEGKTLPVSPKKINDRLTYLSIK